MSGLYIHLPFCGGQKCGYCDFFSLPYDKQAANSYADAVIRNLLRYNYNKRFNTAYFGGGTPSLCVPEIERIMSAVRMNDQAEVTAEANPESADQGKLAALLNCGVNRISFGVQSLSDRILRGLGRRHTAAEAVQAIRLAHSAGFDNLSADLMLCVPGQTKADVLRDIDLLADLPLTHISAYLLKIEPGTPFSQKKLPLPDEDETADMYLSAVERLCSHGFLQYEISNFAREGKQCRHNMNYWRSGEYIGIGVGAHSHYDGKRFAVPKDIAVFINNEEQSTVVTEEKPDTFEEYAMLKLRLCEGLLFDECERFGVKPQDVIQRANRIPKQLIDITERGVALKPEGFLVSNAVIARLLF
jgi:oxygen-independent coproporphyrinogen-3 oxidase